MQMYELSNIIEYLLMITAYNDIRNCCSDSAVEKLKTGMFNYTAAVY
jgi:hypothetical protein